MAEGLTRFSLIVNLGGKEYNYTQSGIKPLFLQLTYGDGLKGAVVADRVIGKAAAFLMVYGGVAEVYTKVISSHAAEVFSKFGVKYTAEKSVDYIVNRSGDDMCPMEKACLNVDTPEKAVEILTEKIK